MKREARKKGRGHRFILNPYEDARFTRCPRCEGKTLLRKFPLLINIEPLQPIALNKSCRFCPACDLIIAHQNEIEHELVIACERLDPSLIGNDYLVLGTLDRADWRRGREGKLDVKDLPDLVTLFREVLKVEPAGGWGPA